ncbi:MAG: hypothetical protein JWQ43_3896 [Glaciihabitans sp.]|nr:hypothetical protein [Glaciihabitans sp.]
MPRTLRKRAAIRPWHIGVLVIVAVVVAAAMSTKVLSIDDATAASTEGQFDPAEYAAEHYEADIAPAIEDNAIDLVSLLSDLNAGADEASLGHSAGSASAYSFPVSFTAVAGAPVGAILPVTVEGVPAETTVQLQIGPAVNGTAIRDVTGTVDFGDFTNQLEFQQVATEFNTIVKDTVLTGIDPATIEGKTLTVVGAFTRVNPALVSVVPVSVEVN